MSDAKFPVLELKGLLKGKIYVQLKGGPIGLELSGSVARLVLLWFDKTLISILKANNLKVYMYKRFIDDIDGAISRKNQVMFTINLPEGWNSVLNKDIKI